MDRGFREGFMGGGRGGGGLDAGLGSGFGWWFGICLTLIAISLITLTVFTILNWRASHGSPGGDAGADADGAKALLDERLARGEIGPDDYTRRITAIRGGGPDG